MNHIANAVAPLKTDAIARAKSEAEKVIARIAAVLTEYDFDLNGALPQPGDLWHSPRLYAIAKADRNLYASVTVRDEERNSTYYYSDGPYYVKMSPTKIARFIEQAQEDAAAQYDAFVAKLVHKIGACDSASLDGNHVWGYSILTVTKGATTERWKTRQIVNTSKLGRLFNQWPTRKVK